MFTVSCCVCTATLPFPTTILVYNQCTCGLHHARPGSGDTVTAAAGVRSVGVGRSAHTVLLCASAITCMSDNKNHHVLSPHYARGPETKHSACTFSFIPPRSPLDPKGQRNKGTCPTPQVVSSAENLSTRGLLPSRTLLPASASSGSTPVPGGHRSAPVSPNAPALDTSHHRNPTLCAPLCLAPSTSPPVPGAPPWRGRWQHCVPIYGGHRLHFRAPLPSGRPKLFLLFKL